MKVRKLIVFLWTVAFVAASLAGCRCGKDKTSDSAGSLNHPPMTAANPQLPALTVDFPERWRARDLTVNVFIESALRIAARGDYDGFRQLFGMADVPPSRQEFQRVWEAVEAIAVVGLYGDGPVPAKYYLHVHVERRQPDRKGRFKLNKVVAVYKEADQWRFGPTPKEIEALITMPSSLPASGPAS